MTGVHKAIAPGLLRPYISLMLIECTSDHEQHAFTELLDFMKEARRDRARRSHHLVRSGFTDIGRFRRSSTRPRGADQIDGFVYRTDRLPHWATDGAPFKNVDHGLAIVLRRDKLFAVCCEQSLRDAVDRWLKGKPTSPFRLVSKNLIQAAFVRGETKGLWLHGMHPRSAFRPRSKHLSGMRLEDSLNPLEDSSFAMSAARSQLPEDPALTSLSGAVGTSPRKGTVWNRQAEDFTDFMNTTIEMMELVEETVTSEHLLLSRPFPILAVESHDLSEVRGAFDIVTMTPDEIPTRTDVSDEVIDAAAILERATFNVIGSEAADFLLEAGLDGSLGGRLQVTVRMKGDRVVFNFGIDGTPTNPGPVRQVLDALKKDDLFAVYYDSGHVVGPHGIGRRNVNSAPFANWRFQDFSGFHITAEKPTNSPKPAEIHALTGGPNDTSLFGWVVQHYSQDWLICDDGPGEVADFVHIGEDDTLSFIHVKKAEKAGQSRGVAVRAFEALASQAVKNSRLLVEPELLKATIELHDSPDRAAWTHGKRVPGYSDFLKRLDGLPPDKKQVIIIQPHVSESVYRRLRSNGSSGGKTTHSEPYRLRMVETLLHTVHGTVVALGADLYVISSKT